MSGDAVTVLLPTYRRPRALLACLESLAAQHDPGVPWDLVVVDNDGEGTARAAVSAMADRFGGRARCVVEERLGTAHARNRGMAEATGTVVAMIDDDEIADPRWLAQLVAPILAGRCEGAVGRVVLDPTVRRPRWFDEDGIGGYLALNSPADEERPFAPGDWLVTSNCALRTELLRQVGGMVTTLGPVGRRYLANEDVLLGRHIEAAGGRLCHVPAAVVIHELAPERLRPRYLLRRAYLQGRSDWLLNAEEYRRLRAGGAGVPWHWMRDALPLRRREGVLRPEVAFHVACDVARSAGLLRQRLTPHRGAERTGR